MAPYLWYYTWSVLLVLCNLGALTATLFALPGNWVILVLSALFAWLIRDPSGGGISLYTVGALLALATIGEIVEFAAGAAGAARSGASRRGMVLSLIGAMIGSLVGAACGAAIPIPLIGSLVGAVGGGAGGAFAGAYLGETWRGVPEDQRFEIGKAAFIGRLLGTAGKLAIGAAMVVVATIDTFLF